MIIGKWTQIKKEKEKESKNKNKTKKNSISSIVNNVHSDNDLISNLVKE